MAAKPEQWLEWAREIQAISQTGLHFNQNEFDIGRYRRLAEISSEIFESYSGLPAGDLLKIFLDQKGYATPKVDVRSAIFKNDQILLVREKADGGWSMPGGWADVNESPSAVAERETWEESGFFVKAKKLVGVFEANHGSQPIEVFHAFKVVFLCEITGGAPRPSSETTDVGFFSESSLPDFSAQRTPPQVVREAFAHHRDPHRPAAFD